MSSKILVLILAVSVSIGLLSGCGLTSKEPEMTPQEVVTKFYRWYIGYPGNPLADKEYRESPYLSDSFIQEVDETIASFEVGGADPILLAQDIPERFTVDEAEISGDQAAVIVSFYWGGNSTPAKRKVDLELTEGEWKIADVSMVEP